MLVDYEKNVLRHYVRESLNNNEQSPHALIELSKKDYGRMKDTCVLLSDITIDTKTQGVSYKSASYGKNIKKRRTILTCGESSFQTDDLYISKIKRNMILILIKKTDAIKLLPTLIITSSTYNSDPSGYVIVLLIKMKPISDDFKKWNDDDFKRIKSCKPNIIQSSSHHQSSGYYASFGNKGSFEKAVSSSVGQYTCKKSSSLTKQLQINNEATYYERVTSLEIKRAVDSFATVIPTIRSVISPVIEVAFDMQENKSDLNLKEGLATKDGCWQSSLCVNATTKCFHTEPDCTYTLISVPNQSMKSKDENINRYDFIFQISQRHHISIKLTPGVSFLFSGMYLTHRQNMCNNTSSCVPSHFFNVASYGNKRLFAHIRKTINKLNA
jgi:hypothetical protein